MFDARDRNLADERANLIKVIDYKMLMHAGRKRSAAAAPHRFAPVPAAGKVSC
ncbi:hypothetical protein [Sinorhizobium arboris]|uniref:hypothetical protein n=1 Tax=Sinorhizobium arboris TaxID=76745 RepID=UPI00130E898B|nr:hypothetical protein [Sinorhizobium arboris]